MNHDDLTLFDEGLAPLFVTPPARPTQVFAYVSRAETIAGAFDDFHVANPWVYDALVRLARDLVARGHRRIGIGMLFEVLRWQWHRATTDLASDFKLNNNYRSRYARLIMELEPDLVDVFETRSLSAA